MGISAYFMNPEKCLPLFIISEEINVEQSQEVYVIA